MDFLFSARQIQIIDALLLTHNKILAIRELRAYTGCDLKASVDYCHERESYLRETASERFATNPEKQRRLLEECGISNLLNEER